MLNEKLGAPGIAAPKGRRGCALYGPYREMTAGHIRVAFHIVPFGPPPADDAIVAYVDVVGDVGQRYFAADFVLASELNETGSVTLDAALPETSVVEYRVHPTGVLALFVGDPPGVSYIDEGSFIEGRLTKASGAEIGRIALSYGERLEDLLSYVGPPPSLDERELGRILRGALQLLRPHRVLGWEKERIGSKSDGGYVCVPDFDGVDAILSLGVSDNVDFDESVAARGVTVYQYDHTVDDPRPHDARLVFHKTMIGVQDNGMSETLSTLIRRHDRGDRELNLVLKIDIEGWEWPVFDMTDETDLGRIRQITGEFHAFEFVRFPVWRERMLRVLSKIARKFVLVHVHGNNCAPTTLVDGVSLPNVMELTFVNRMSYETEPSGELFPSALDAACDPTSPDYSLGAFIF